MHKFNTKITGDAIPCYDVEISYNGSKIAFGEYEVDGDHGLYNNNYFSIDGKRMRIIPSEVWWIRECIKGIAFCKLYADQLPVSECPYKWKRHKKEFYCGINELINELIKSGLI